VGHALVVVVAVAAGLVTSLLVCAAALSALRRLGVVDVPNDRSSHGRPTVRGVGVGVACGGVLGLLAAGAAAAAPAAWSWRTASVLLAAAVGLGAIGFVDDLRGGTSFRIRLLGQVVVAAAAAISLGPLGSAPAWRAAVLGAAVIWIVGYVNAFNFMDGINGISAVTAVVTGVMFAVVGRREGLPVLEAGGAALAAASLGFLPFNLPTARAFFGDAGSYFLSTWIAVLAYVAVLSGVRWDVVLAPLALYLADVGVTLLLRLRRGEQWHAAHRDHVYQKLAAGGLGHIGTTLVVLAGTTALSALGLASPRAPGWRALAWSAMAALVGAYLVAPTLLRRHVD